MSTKQTKLFFKALFGMLLIFIISLTLGLMGSLISLLLHFPPPWKFLLPTCGIIVLWTTIAITFIIIFINSNRTSNNDDEDDFIPPNPQQAQPPSTTFN